MNIQNRKESSCFIIAEIGLNHNGDFQLAKSSIEAAAAAGADAVKFQNFKTEDFLGDKSILHTYKDGDHEIVEPLFDICKRSEFQSIWFPELIALSAKLGVKFLSTPTSTDGIDELLRYGVEYLKNGSDYLTHLENVDYMARTCATIILSTGMAFEEEIDDAINTLRKARPNLNDVVILHCTSNYPTAISDVNLNKIITLSNKYDVPVGFSDHTVGWEAAVQAVSLGAVVLEKHFTLDKNLPGPDHWFSTDPQEFKTLVEQVRLAEKRLGRPDLTPAAGEEAYLKDWKLGLYWRNNKDVGSVITRKDLIVRKPALGLSPKEIEDLVGKQLKRNCSKGDAVLARDIKW
ncbi:N-acetylneuraminate synthase family protein [Alphaproteobacteria bacterium]|nr:N-acetylneuraminate synthase family protein [Alphaproteobacteria bacterium]